MNKYCKYLLVSLVITFSPLTYSSDSPILGNVVGGVVAVVGGLGFGLDGLSVLPLDASTILLADLDGSLSSLLQAGNSSSPVLTLPLNPLPLAIDTIGQMPPLLDSVPVDVLLP